MYQATTSPNMLFALEHRLLLSADLVVLAVEARGRRYYLLPFGDHRPHRAHSLRAATTKPCVGRHWREPRSRPDHRAQLQQARQHTRVMRLQSLVTDYGIILAEPAQLKLTVFRQRWYNTLMEYYPYNRLHRK